MQLFDTTIKEILSERLLALENYFTADVVFYFGPIDPAIEKTFRDFIEKLKEDGQDRKRLVKELRQLIRNYNDLLIEYIGRSELRFFLHSRLYL